MWKASEVKAPPGELGKDVRAAVQGMLLRFDDQQSSAFGEDEAVAAEIERPAGGSWIVVSLGKGTHVRHSGDRRAAQARLGAAGDDEIGLIPLDHLRGLDKGLHARGARRRRGDGRTVDTECHRNLAARHIRREERDGQRMNPLGAFRHHGLDVRFHDGNAAAAAVDDGADALTVFGIDLVAGVL